MVAEARAAVVYEERNDPKSTKGKGVLLSGRGGICCNVDGSGVWWSREVARDGWSPRLV